LDGVLSYFTFIMHLDRSKNIYYLYNASDIFINLLVKMHIERERKREI
jgi:hypothetical protein